MDEKELESLLITQSEDLSDEFMKEFMPVVEAIASNIFKSGMVPSVVDFGDLVGWGIEGLVKAKTNFKPSKNAKFSTYAYYRIRGEIMDKIRKEWHHRNPEGYRKYKESVKQQVAELATDLIETTKEDKSQKDPVSQVMKSTGMMVLLSRRTVPPEEQRVPGPEELYDDDSSSIIWSEVSDLESHEQEIILLLYQKGLKQNEVATQLNYSKSKVSRIHMRAIIKLRGKLDKVIND